MSAPETTKEATAPKRASATMAPVRSRRIKRQLPIGTSLAVGWLVVLAIAAVTYLLGVGPDPTSNDYSAINQAPSLQHPFGTDNLGRDMLSRALHGAGASGFVAITTIVVGGGVGIMLGVLAGLVRGFVETAVGFLTDVTIALPGLIIVSTIIALTGPSLFTIAMILALFTIPFFARMSRATTLSIATENHVIVARTLGASRWRILTREVMPGVLPMMMPVLMTTVAGSIVGEGTLSFLGFGIRPPEPSWGSIIAQGRTQLMDAPWVALIPAFMICLTVLSINVLGEHFRETRR